MIKKQCALFIAFVLFVFSCARESKDSLDTELRTAIVASSITGSMEYFIMPDSDDYDNIPNQDPNNPITKEKVELGQKLFFETGLAQSPQHIESYETYSCATCHVPSTGFLPGRVQGIADGGRGFGKNGNYRVIDPTYMESELDAQGNRPLTVMNSAFVTNTLWSGTFGANDNNIGTEQNWKGIAEVNFTGLSGLEAQNIEGLHLHRMEINDKVLYEFGYASLFDKAFADIPESERYTPTTASFALSAYLRTILTNRAPFQEFLKGNSGAMTTNQKLGGLIFFGKGNCAKCHITPSFSANNYYCVGTKDLHENGGVNTSPHDPRTLGRASFTGEPYDNYRFKVPQLYNLQEYATFFHGSSKNTIEEVIDYKIAAIPENAKVADNQVSLTPLNLSEKDKSDLIDFLTWHYMIMICKDTCHLKSFLDIAFQTMIQYQGLI